MDAVIQLPAKAASGISGLDSILGGGFERKCVFLLEGSPGTGKTTIALHFLREGAARGETGLYITLSETERELRASVAAHGWTLDPKIAVFELIPPENVLDPNQRQSLLYSSDLELGETMAQIQAQIEEVKPSLIVIDSLSEIRLLAQSSLRYRRQLLALKHFLSRHRATVLLLDDLTSEPQDMTVHSIAHGVIRLEQNAPNYGAERRRLRVRKYRGQAYRGGYHDLVIKTGGLHVFPRLIAAEHRRVDCLHERLTSGIQELDNLLGGGIERGSSTLVLGASGTGKSTLTLQFIAAAAKRGEKAAMFVFDEEVGLLLARTKQLGIDLDELRDAGTLVIEQVDAAELTPGEFIHRVRELVDEAEAKTVVIDSLNGYTAAMPEEQGLILHMHELLQYLNRQGVATFLTIAQLGLVGDMKSPVDITYLADTAILLRYFEAQGRVRRAISVLKKRASGHEDTIREYEITAGGIKLGPPLCEFQGVLRGVPAYVGSLGEIEKPTATLAPGG